MLSTTGARIIIKNVTGLTSGMRCFSHVPVMAKEVVDVLKPEDGKVYIDMTFGGGGHTRQLLASDKSIKVIAIDRDPLAVDVARKLSHDIERKSERLGINQSVVPIHGKFSFVMKQIHLSGIPYDSVDGVLFDLGASSMQFDDPLRGFGLSAEGQLDMRMDPSNVSDITAEDVVNNLDEEDLSTIFKLLGEEKRSRKAAAAIVDARNILGRIKTTRELASVIKSSSLPTLDALCRSAHPATRIFQALRIFVNNELNELNYAMEKVRQFLKLPDGNEDQAKGIAVVISFHSLEDRIVKRHFSGIDPNEPIVPGLSQHGRIRTSMIDTAEGFDKIVSCKKWEQLWKHVKKPSTEEIEFNPRSRSARMRAATRVA